MMLSAAIQHIITPQQISTDKWKKPLEILPLTAEIAFQYAFIAHNNRFSHKQKCFRFKIRIVAARIGKKIELCARLPTNSACHH